MHVDSLPFIDTHHHLWDLTRHRYAWLDGDGLADTTAWIGDYAAIRRSYVVEDLLADTAGCGLTKSVHIEAVWGEDPVGETRWLQGIADRTGFPHGIVAFTDLRAPGAEAELDQHRQSANLRGIRMTGMGDLVSDPGFRRGFAALARRGLSYDLNIRWPKMQAALELARVFPNVPIIVGNTANPVSLGEDEFCNWRNGMRLLARAPNVAVKISGLGMADHRWTEERIRPWVIETVAIFGADRCMFGSNWPVDSLYSSYRVLVDAYRATIASLSTAEQEAVLWRNAERYYRI